MTSASVIGRLFASPCWTRTWSHSARFEAARAARSVSYSIATTAVWSGQMGQDGRVVAGAGSDMDDALTFSRPSVSDQGRVEGGLPVVDPTTDIDRERPVDIDMARVVVGCLAEVSRSKDRPRPGTQEQFALHIRECLF